MRSRYKFSDCLGISYGDFRIFTDPWFTDGIYDFIFTILDSFGAIFTRLHLSTPDSKIVLINKSELSSFNAFSEIRSDLRCFVGLLSGQFHWNNAIVVHSCMQTSAQKNDFRTEVQSYLCYLTSRNLKT